MSRRQVTPTRSNLMDTRKTLELARVGHDILDKKSEVLTVQLVRAAHDAARVQSEMQALVAVAYGALDEARLVMGREHLEWAALSVPETIEIEITPRSVMGVTVPHVEIKGGPPEVTYGMGNTTVALDEMVHRFRAVLAKVPELAQAFAAVWRLADELQKTRRRVNALEHVFIPEYEQTVDYIEDVLDEREREELSRMKQVKSKRDTGGEAGRGTLSRSR
jgi:V/A-type H+/Na+-transporting ATPase subunit D